jgi:hypothetical protein
MKLVSGFHLRRAFPLLGAGRRPSRWPREGAWLTVAPMRHRARELATGAFPVLALALTVGAAVVGCTTAGAPAGVTRPATTRAAATVPATRAAATRAAAPIDGPAAPDPACAAAENAEQTLQSRQGKDQNDESALDQDFMKFAAALGAAAQSEKRPAAARAMTALANDYTALVESQSGAAQLPSVSQIQKDGAAFDKACSL